MGSERRGDVPKRETFVRALDSLKDGGSTVLVVGEDARGAHEGVCRRLLGDEHRSRYRVFVSIEADSRPHVESVVAVEGSVRSIDYADLEAESSEEPLSALSLELIEAIDDIDDEADGLEPGELRVCVDSVRPLLGTHSTEQVFRALHAITARIKGANGIGHVHLPVEPDHEGVSVLDPLFDATVEVRTKGTDHQHRWRLRDEDASSGWLPVDH